VAPVPFPSAGIGGQPFLQDASLSSQLAEQAAFQLRAAVVVKARSFHGPHGSSSISSLLLGGINCIFGPQ
jgi:hypothetical protein